MRFAIFPVHLSNYCACHEKVMPGHAKCCACHAKSSQQTWRSDAPKCNPSQEISALTSEQLRWKCLVVRLPRKMHLCRSSSNVPRLPSFLAMLQNPHILLTFEKVHNPLRLPRETSSERPKLVHTWCVLYILTSKCASRHNGMHFFDIATSKSAPNQVCLVHFDFEMRFAPQRRALFRHLNFQKWSDPGVFCTFWLGNVLRATTACTFSSLIWPDGSAPATHHWKNTMFRDFPTFSRICIFFLLTLSLLWSSLFYSSLLSGPFYLCFSSGHIVGSLTSKLPSTTTTTTRTTTTTTTSTTTTTPPPCPPPPPTTTTITTTTPLPPPPPLPLPLLTTPTTPTPTPTPAPPPAPPPPTTTTTTTTTTPTTPTPTPASSSSYYYYSSYSSCCCCNCNCNYNYTKTKATTTLQLQLPLH